MFVRLKIVLPSVSCFDSDKGELGSGDSCPLLTQTPTVLGPFDSMSSPSQTNEVRIKILGTTDSNVVEEHPRLHSHNLRLLCPRSESGRLILTVRGVLRTRMTHDWIWSRTTRVLVILDTLKPVLSLGETRS